MGLISSDLAEVASAQWHAEAPLRRLAELSDPITPNQVVSGLMALARDLDTATKRLRHVEHEAVIKREKYALAFAKALLKSDGSNSEIRKASATEATHEERIDAELADAEVRLLKEEIWTIKTRIDVGRSAAAAIRAEIALQ